MATIESLGKVYWIYLTRYLWKCKERMREVRKAKEISFNRAIECLRKKYKNFLERAKKNSASTKETNVANISITFKNLGVMEDNTLSEKKINDGVDNIETVHVR